MPAIVVVGTQGTQPTHQHHQLRRGKGQELRLVHQHRLGRNAELALAVVAEAVCNRLEQVEGLDIGLVLTSIDPARGERYRDAHPGGLGSQFDTHVAG
ncbi:hypothetical protein D9M70_568090 [compost metagenome]